MGWGSNIVSAVVQVAAVSQFDPWPQNFPMLQAWPKRKKRKELKVLFQSRNFKVLNRWYRTYLRWTEAKGMCLSKGCFSTP